MTITPPSFLRNLWYYALPSSKLKCGKILSRVILNEPILFCRDQRGQVFALRDICPHRGIPLSEGRCIGDEIECCYHGWRFNQKGNCTLIPSLVGHEGIQPDNIKVRSYHVVERQNCIWIFIEDTQRILKERPTVPFLPDVGDIEKPFICESMIFPCFVDHAVVGLMDPAHGPFVHVSWWWRKASSIHEKAKVFSPSYLGFTMVRHKPSRNSFAYKLLGGTPETEISFQLPGIRIEHIRIGTHSVTNLTCVTPITETETEITHSMYTTVRWIKWLAPILRVFAISFLSQDKNIVLRQQKGLKYEQNLLLIRDSDTQARWYYQLKNEFVRCHTQVTNFNNPIKEVVLRWRS